MPLTVATFNVKNLLLSPALPAEAPGDARGRAEALRANLPAKLDFIARTLVACDADVVGLQEIGPPELARAIGDRLSGYGEPIVGTSDARGIRCALLSRIPVRHAAVHTAPALSFPVFDVGDPPPFGARVALRRGVVHARVDAPGLGALDVMVVHFKSPRPLPLRDASGASVEPMTARERAEGAVRSLVWRAAEALHVRGLVDAVLSADRDAHVAVVGDMNDGPGSIVLRTLGGDGLEALLDCADEIDSTLRFTILSEGRALQLDHVLATRRLRARVRAARILNAGLRDHRAPPLGEAEQPTVDSDHAPLVVDFG